MFLIGVDEKNRQEIALLVNDPDHKNVKARLWSLNSDDWQRPVELATDLRSRIRASLEKRKKSSYISERENYYLINAESDFLPGLLVLKLKNQILVQYYALFWKKIESTLLEVLQSELAGIFPEAVIHDIWIQERNFDQKKNVRSINNHKSADFVLNEYDINYQIRINEHYDFGIYTDMSSIRSQMKPYLQKSKSVLNLYSYTGAFSLFSLKLGATEVVSVDLSSKYLNWLDENIALNPDLTKAAHTAMCMPSEKALEKLIAENKKYEAIICDPPSASSDGLSTSSALKSYEKLLPLMLKLLSQNGSLFVFLNTHTISWNKFEEKLKQIIAVTEYSNQVNIGKRFKLSDDCAPLKGFHEGDYLKGFLIDFKNKG